MHSLDQGRFTVAAGACGVVRACLERSVEYARERETFGQAIGRYQFVQDMIATMVLGYETSKLLVMQAAWMKNQGKRNTRETSLAKWHATESAFEAAHLAIQVFGSYGYCGGVRHRAVLPQRARADHLRGHDADPQDDAGRACARLPPPERPRRRRVADLLVGAGAVAGARLSAPTSAQYSVGLAELRAVLEAGAVQRERLGVRVDRRVRRLVDRRHREARVASESLRTACAPAGPSGKQTRSPARSVRSPSGVRSVTSPSTTSSHSSEPSSKWYGHVDCPGSSS